MDLRNNISQAGMPMRETIQLQANHDTFLHALLKGDRNLCSEIIRTELKNDTPFIELYERLLKTSLYKVGELWEYNQISVATEHLASAIIEAILNEIYPTIQPSQFTQKSVVLTCVEDELHQVGIRMAGDIFELHGWNTLFLGANTPVNELMEFLKEKNPDIVAISISLYFHFPMLETMIQKIRNEFPDTWIFTGGQAFKHGGADIISKYKNVIYFPDLFTLSNMLKSA